MLRKLKLTIKLLWKERDLLGSLAFVLVLAIFFIGLVVVLLHNIADVILQIDDPIERGLTCIAIAIILHMLFAKHNPRSKT